MTTAILTPDDKRVDRITAMFGNIPFDNAIFNVADDIADNYNGGFWNYFEDNKGQFLYMAPADGHFSLSIEGNGFTGIVDADTFGIITSLIGISHLMMYLFETHRHHNNEHLNDLFFRLRDLAINHENSAKIMQAID